MEKLNFNPEEKDVIESPEFGKVVSVVQHYEKDGKPNIINFIGVIDNYWLYADKLNLKDDVKVSDIFISAGYEKYYVSDGKQIQEEHKLIYGIFIDNTHFDIYEASGIEYLNFIQAMNNEDNSKVLDEVYGEGVLFDNWESKYGMGLSMDDIKEYTEKIKNSDKIELKRNDVLMVTDVAKNLQYNSIRKTSDFLNSYKILTFSGKEFNVIAESFQKCLELFELNRNYDDYIKSIEVISSEDINFNKHCSKLII